MPTLPSISLRVITYAGLPVLLLLLQQGLRGQHLLQELSAGRIVAGSWVKAATGVAQTDSSRNVGFGGVPSAPFGVLVLLALGLAGVAARCIIVYT